MTGENGQVPFQAHIELLQSLLACREQIVAKIEGLLNAQGRPAGQLQDRALLSRQIEDCFFGLTSLTPGQRLLSGQLQEAHRTAGFRPSGLPGLHNDLIDPAEMMRRGFHQWRLTRWPGRNGRVRFAHALFNLYLIRHLELLIMRIWDEGTAGAAGRLSQVQAELDRLRASAPADQPALVRDAHWLIPLAQSPANEELAPYFEVALRIAELPDEDQVAIHSASVRMAGGHLRSQLLHYIQTKGESLADNSLILRTRRSNALDVALAVQSLVILLRAYVRAIDEDDREQRASLAAAICQGISADPELFVNRLDLLGPYTMIEELFVAAGEDGQAAYTATGTRHRMLLQEYATLITRLSQNLHADCRQFRPVAGTYSPYGIVYGFSYNLLEHMAQKTLQPEAPPAFSLEDAFADGDTGKLAWVNGWRRLPHVSQEVQRRYDYPQQFAADIFERIEHALQRRAAAGDVDAYAGARGRLFVAAEDAADMAAAAAGVPELPPRYFHSSNPALTAAGKALAQDQADLLHDRQEGMFLVSYRTPGGWVAVSKDLLTEVLGAGQDAKISGLPAEAARVLKLMCSGPQPIRMDSSTSSAKGVDR